MPIKVDTDLLVGPNLPTRNPVSQNRRHDNNNNTNNINNNSNNSNNSNNNNNNNYGNRFRNNKFARRGSANDGMKFKNNFTRSRYKNFVHDSANNHFNKNNSSWRQKTEFIPVNRDEFENGLAARTFDLDINSRGWALGACNPAHMNEYHYSGIPDGTNYLSTHKMFKFDCNVKIAEDEELCINLIPDLLTPLITYNLKSDDFPMAYKFSNIADQTTYMSENKVTNYRITAQSMTITNCTNSLNKNGVIYGCKQVAQYKLIDSLYRIILPDDQTELTANSKSTSWGAKEGMYIINNNCSPTYQLIDCDEKPSQLLVVHGENQVTPHFNENTVAYVYSDSLKSGWSTSTAIISVGLASTFNIKVNMSVQFCISPDSNFVGSIMQPPPMDYSALMFVSNFFNFNNTIYEAKFNDWNSFIKKVKETISKFKPLIKPGEEIIKTLIPASAPVINTIDKLLGN